MPVTKAQRPLLSARLPASRRSCSPRCHPAASGSISVRSRTQSPEGLLDVHLHRRRSSSFCTTAWAFASPETPVSPHFTLLRCRTLRHFTVRFAVYVPRGGPLALLRHRVVAISASGGLSTPARTALALRRRRPIARRSAAQSSRSSTTRSTVVFAEAPSCVAGRVPRLLPAVRERPRLSLPLGLCPQARSRRLAG